LLTCVTSKLTKYIILTASERINITPAKKRRIEENIYLGQNLKSMKCIRITLLILLTGTSALLNAAGNLGWGATTFSKDTLFLGDTLIITTSLKNYDVQAYNDSVGFALTINSVLNVNQNIFPNPYPVQPVSISAGDSLPASLIIVITPAYFLVGPDILVVWPKAKGGTQAHDSIVKTIIVLDPTLGIDKQQKNLPLVNYRNNMLFVSSGDPETQLNRVRIFNLLGEELINAPLDEKNSIPFNKEPNGIYLAEVNYNGTQKRIIRIVKY
jgi:hypothetical protein